MKPGKSIVITSIVALSLSLCLTANVRGQTKGGSAPNPKSHPADKAAATAEGTALSVADVVPMIPRPFSFEGSEVLVVDPSGVGFKLTRRKGKWVLKEGNPPRAGKVRMTCKVPEGTPVPDEARIGNGNFNAMTGKAGYGGLTVVVERRVSPRGASSQSAGPSPKPQEK
jgi:hypothetical protein